MQVNFNKNLVLSRVNHWLDTIVIGLNLCPFAGSVVRSGRLAIVLLETVQVEDCLQELIVAAEQLAVADKRNSSLLVLCAGFDNFDDYLDLVAISEALLADRGFDGVLQLASFHPDYCFDGALYDDLGNWTNRSPYPILHLLTEASVSQAVNAHPDPDSIPLSNIRTISELGIEEITALFRLHQ